MGDLLDKKKKEGKNKKKKKRRGRLGLTTNLTLGRHQPKTPLSHTYSPGRGLKNTEGLEKFGEKTKELVGGGGGGNQIQGTENVVSITHLSYKSTVKLEQGVLKRRNVLVWRGKT